MLAMTIYELATNAMKHGALSCDGGRVDIEWSVSEEADAPTFSLGWRESGGPPAAKPKRTGFGSVVTRRLSASMFDAKVEANYAPEGFAWRLNCPLGKIVGTLGATMVVAVSMALASVTVKEATGIDPEHLSYAVTFLAPLMAGFLLTAGTMLVVVGVFVWFVIESVWGVLRWRFGSGTDAKPVNTDKVLIRLVGVVALALTTAVIFDIGQHSYNGVLTTTARRLTYHFEMYPNDACAFGGERVRRLTDDMVAVGRSTDQGLVFEQRPCALGETAQATLGRESVGTDPSPEAATSPPDGRVDWTDQSSIDTQSPLCA